jgi:hypothetical protein
MRTIITIILTTCSLLLSVSAQAQVGIGTIMPDSSAVLDLSSIDRGLLLPRLTMAQRDVISNPATGLMIYNLSSSDVQVNTGTPASPVWFVNEGSPDSSIISVTLSGDVSTTSTSSVLIDGTTLSPPAGTYLVLFNGQYGLLASEPISTAQAAIDLNVAYTALMDIPGTDTHAPVLGNGEIMTAGVYDMAAAASLAGTLTLDGEGDTNAVFVFRVTGALTTGALTTVVLINGARSNNIFWISEGALALAATTIMKGTLIAHAGAVSAAAGSDLEGRMFSVTGALSFGPGTAYIPTGDSFIDLGVLSTFVMFTSVGAVSNTDPSTITGDVGTNAGAIAGFENLNGNVYSPGGAPPPTNNTLVTFGVFQNGVLVPFSSRTNDVNTSVIALQALATVTAGQEIDIRWYVDSGEVLIGNRILTLLNVQ